jgi:hypothetical protein
MPTPFRSRQDSPGIRRKPAEAAREQVLGLYVLPYGALRRAADQQLLQFLHSTYIAVAGARHWDRAALETVPHRLRHHLARNS